MTDVTPVWFELDGHRIEAKPDETIWSAAARAGTRIPHLCHAEEPGYRPDGNCRVCMVEIEGDRVLQPACRRVVTEGMVVRAGTERAERARRTVIELLLADQPPPELAHDRRSRLWHWAGEMGVQGSRYPARAHGDQPPPDSSHPAMRVHLDACIHCNLCVRACREVQVNDVIGMAGRGPNAKIVFDFDDLMGESTCVACGECVQACPTGALMEASMVDAAGIGDSTAFDRSADSVCPYCGVGCQITYRMREEKIVRVDGRDGPANEKRLCVKGRFGFDYITHRHRLTRPLVRREGVPKNLEVDPGNPHAQFREVDWEEALDFAAGGLARLRDAHGGRAVAGFGSAKCSNEEAYLFQKLIRSGFGHNNLDHCTRLCHASSVAALMEGIGSGAVTATFNQIEHADVAIAIGCNPTENHPVAATYFKQFARRGGQLFVLDPRGHSLRQHATRMLQFRPATDVALLNAMLHTVIEEGLADRQYVDAYTEGFEELRAHLQDYAPERMAEICGIAAEEIREVARAFAKARAAMIFWGMGISQHVHGTDNARCLISLALITGQVGRPGTGLHPLRGQNNVQGASDAGLIPMVLPDYQPVTDAGARDACEELWGIRIDPEPGLTVVEIINAAHAGEVKGMYILGENPAMSDPDLDHARTALARLEHLVVQDLFLTETAMLADIVLPAAAWPEKSGTVTNTNRQVQMGRQALAPPDGARADWRILVDLAGRLGLDWNYESPAEVFAEMKQLMPSLENIDWARLERESAVTYPSLGPEDPGQAVVFGDGFPRPGGRGRLVPAALTSPAEEPDSEYPLVLTTGRQLEHWHTGAISRRASVLDRLEPAPTASLNYIELDRLGIAAGDPIRVLTRRGEVVLTARADDSVAEGMVFIPFAYVEAAANLLTNPQLDPIGKIPEYKYCAARVEPAHTS